MENALINQTFYDYRHILTYLNKRADIKPTPKYLYTPCNYEIDNMIFSYANAFKKLPKEIEKEITEIEWFEWYCYTANKSANEVFQIKTENN